MAGVKPDDVDVLMGYDSFTITALLHLEDLGLLRQGRGRRVRRGRRTAPGGALPMNTNGGGLSYTHPGMYGMFLIVEAVRQLRGEAAPARSTGAEIAVAHGSGMVLSCMSTLVLGTEATLCDRDRRRSGPFEPPVTELTAPVLGRHPRAAAPAASGAPRARPGVVPARGVPRSASVTPSSGARPRARARSTRASSSTGPDLPALFGDEPVRRRAGRARRGRAADDERRRAARPTTVGVGMPVRVTWEPLSDGRNLPQFEPA